MSNEFRALTRRRGGCTEFIGPKTADGYGYFKNMVAHRYAWELARGPIPKGMLICHTCDNKLCVDVKHMWCGTPQDNQVDFQLKQDARRQSRTLDGKKMVQINLRITAGMRALLKLYAIRNNTSIQGVLNEHVLVCASKEREALEKDGAKVSEWIREGLV